MRDPFPTDGIPFYRGKRVAVTGASGLIGSYAVKLLKESGAWVRAVFGTYREPNEFTNLADEVSGYDLESAVVAKAAVGGRIDIAIGCAGITGGVNLPSLDPVSYVGPATAMVINTLDACHRAGVKRFGFLSSTTVYAPSYQPVKEEDSDKPDALYQLYRGIGESKRWLEKLCKYYHETTGIGVGIVRPSGAYGRFDNFDEKTSHVLPGMVARAMRLEPGQPFEVWGDGGDVRDFVHAQDVARCLLLAVAECPNAEPINAASGVGVTTRQLALEALTAVGSWPIDESRLKFSTDKPSALRTRLVNVSKAVRVLGFKAEIGLADGIRDVVEYRRSL